MRPISRFPSKHLAPQIFADYLFLICDQETGPLPEIQQMQKTMFCFHRWKWKARSEFNPPLCPSFLPLIPLEEARYSSRYCPQAQPGAPQAAPRADRAPMQSRERLACGTWEDHRIQTRPPVSKLDLAFR